MASLAHQPSTPTSANQAIEVAVVGAGLSGLHCCKTILENSKSNNINVTLIEAQNAVGGRTRAIQVDNDTIVDLGASWIHMPVNNPVAYFVQTYGKMESNVQTEFLSLPFEENSIVYPADIEFKKYSKYFEEILQEVGELNNLNPSNNSLSLQDGVEKILKQYESMPPEDLANEALSPEIVKNMRRLISVFLECISIIVGGDSSQLPLKDFEEGGGLDISGGNVVVSSTFGNAVQTFHQDLVSKYPNNFKTFLLHEMEQVTLKDEDNNSNSGNNTGKNIIIHTIIKNNGKNNNEKNVVKKFNVDVAIITLPLGVLKKNHTKLFPNGMLPSYKIEAIKNLGFGNVFKLYLCFTDLFWIDEDDYEAKQHDEAKWLIVPSSNLGEFQIFLDYSTVTKKPILLAFAGGENATILENLDENTIIKKALNSLSTGMDISMDIIKEKLISITKSTWGTSPYSCGAYSFLHKSSEKIDRTKLESPIRIGNNDTNNKKRNNIYFAGEACHSHWSGTTHGALDSGRDAGLLFLKEHEIITSVQLEQLRKSKVKLCQIQ